MTFPRKTLEKKYVDDTIFDPHILLFILRKYTEHIELKNQEFAGIWIYSYVLNRNKISHRTDG